MDLRGKRALVMGLGVHGGGLGVARFLVGQGATVTITDLRGPEQLQSSLDALAGLPIQYVLGEHRDEDFRDADLVIRNPGVPRESRYLQVARAHGAAIEMEMTLFFRLCRGPILGITGTKGKTTTTLLTAAMLRGQYPDTIVAGNLRVSALEALPRITASTPVVLELSSWQLEGLGEAKLSPKYACITNISPDHLDRYGSMEAYVEAKRQIYWWQKPEDVLVLNFDDPFAKGHSAFWDVSGQRRGGRVVYCANRALGSFSMWPFDDTAVVAIRYGDRVFWNDFAGVLGEPSSRTIDPNIPAPLGQPLFDVNDIKLLGAHNLSDVIAAAALAKSFGIKSEHIRTAVRNFTGVEHRLEFVRELDGIRYVNDTAATAPEAAIAALRSFDRPIVLIAGGADKNLPFADLAREIALRAKAVVLLKGTATPKLEQALHNERVKGGTGERVITRSNEPIAHPLTRSPAHPLTLAGPFDDFAAAIAAAHGLAEPGDVVLLSPGCASFGMFRNEFHRGEEFRRIVNGFNG